MILDRFRVARLIALSAAERTLAGPERGVRESEVATLIKAAYDEASEEARAAFMARVKPMPVTAWPWTAVQALQPVQPGGPSPGEGAKFAIKATPDPAKPGRVPALMILLRGQVTSADKLPGNELPPRGTPEAFLWEPLYRALDTWDTTTIERWIGPQGWMSATGAQVDPAAGAEAPGGNLPSGGAIVSLWSKPVVAAGVVVTGVSLVLAVATFIRAGNASARLEDQLRAVRERG